MSTSKDAYKTSWQPPVRPEWVQGMNDEGKTMDLKGVVPLDEESLLRSAQYSTGLSDFGSDEWREPFRMLIKALDDESELNLMGRLWARDELLLLLQARLNVEDTYKHHPEIEDQEVAQPIIILGQGRSGTSFLQNMLSEIPENKSLLQWESTFPCPPPEAATYTTDPRIARSDAIAKRFVRVTPTQESMHEYGALFPQECCEVMSMTFMAPSWLGLLGQVPSYDQYIIQQDFTPAMEYHKKVLKLLQWKNPRKHWVLKDTQHMDRLELVQTMYPDARFIWAHRDPLRAFASVISLIGTAQWGRCDAPFTKGSYEFVTDMTVSAGRLNGVIAQLEAGVVAQDHIYHLLYTDLVAEPAQSIEKIYAHLGLDLSPGGKAAVDAYIKANPRTARPKHKVNQGTQDDVAAGRKAFGHYQAHFGIADEV